MLISVCLTSDIRLCAPPVAQGTRPILAATSEDRFAARAALSPRSSLLWDGFLSLFMGPPPQKHLQIWTAKTGTFLFELCWAFSCNPCTRWNAGGRQQSVITSRTANRGKKKKVPKEMKPWSKWNQKECSCLHEWSQDYPPSQDDKTLKFIYTFTLVFCQQ